jgi:hypothetical protein
MAESTLRQNRRGATHQLATARNQARMMVLVAEPFYRHDSLGPGADLIAITGQGEGDGYYDWAGRRLFTIDGEPDPMCPGAYRYQHNPACCDLEAPDSDPRSPRYEPMHLRHKPGDTWIIDTNRPHDPYDPGPFGSPGWYKDERTGRHRRDETPDPLPAEDWIPPANAWFPGTADWPEPEPPQSKARKTGEQTDQRGGSDRPPPWGSRGRPVPSEPDEPEEPQRPWGARTGRPGPSPGTDRPSRQPWDRGGPGDAGWISGYGRRQSKHDDEQDNGEGGNEGGRSESDSTGEYRFSKLREDAFDRFIANSSQLRAAHFAPQKPYLRERAVWVLRWLMWVAACGLLPMPKPLTTHQPRLHAAEPQRIPAPRSAPTEAVESRPEETPTKAPSAAPRVPGAAIAAAINGTRAARRTIAARESRTEHDLARAVRNSATRRPSPRPYMTTWEHAFDTNAAFVFGGAA